MTAEGTNKAHSFPLKPGDVHVWRLQVSEWLDVLPSFWGLLSDEERTRAHRFRSTPDRTRFILGRGALRVLASHYLGRPPESLSIRQEAMGKPRIETQPQDGAFGINLSHSGNWILVAAGGMLDLGIDVEQHEDEIDVAELMPSVFSPWEQRTLLSLPSEMHRSSFFDIWTRKEAVIKADGAGVSFGLSRFDVEFRPDRAATVRRIEGESPDTWTLHALPLAPGYSAAVACRVPNATVTLDPPSSSNTR